jgi:CRISPR/Cas system-associated endonuclease Cas3-HD
VIVIEGHVGKSKVLAQLLENVFKYRQPLVINTVSHGMILRSAPYEEIRYNSNDTLRHELTVEFLMEVIKEGGYNVVVFEVNDIPANMVWYLKMELALKVDCIVTIQNNTLDELVMYDAKNVLMKYKTGDEIMDFERWLEQVEKVWDYDMLTEYERTCLIRKYEKWALENNF